MQNFSSSLSSNAPAREIVWSYCSVVLYRVIYFFDIAHDEAAHCFATTQWFFNCSPDFQAPLR